MDIKKSKFLSYVLRHNPNSIGITLDENGWADVDALLQNSKLTRQELDEIVLSDEKKRYAMSDKGNRIRANQGHSVSVDLALPPQTPPANLFHGTHAKAVSSIMDSGINRARRTHVHLSDTISTSLNVGRRHGRPVVLSVDSATMHRDGFVFYRSANGVWLTKHVNPKYLSFA